MTKISILLLSMTISFMGFSQDEKDKTEGLKQIAGNDSGGTTVIVNGQVMDSWDVGDEFEAIDLTGLSQLIEQSVSIGLTTSLEVLETMDFNFDLDQDIDISDEGMNIDIDLDLDDLDIDINEIINEAMREVDKSLKELKKKD